MRMLLFIEMYQGWLYKAIVKNKWLIMFRPLPVTKMKVVRILIEFVAYIAFKLF